MRLDRTKYMENLLRIRTSRPAKPWAKVKDLSIIYTPDRMNADAGKMLRDIWIWTFTPYQVYLPLPDEQLAKLETEMPNVIPVPVAPQTTRDKRIDAALARCEGDLVALVPKVMPVSAGWVEVPARAVVNSVRPLEAVRLEGDAGNFPAGVFRKHELLHARRTRCDCSIKRSLEAAGLIVRDVDHDELPFAFDDLLNTAKALEKNGESLKAARLYEHIDREHGNALWMKLRAGKAYYDTGGYDARALELSRELNSRRPTVDSLLLEARLHRRADRIDQGIDVLERAQKLLQRKG